MSSENKVQDLAVGTSFEKYIGAASTDSLERMRGLVSNLRFSEGFEKALVGAGELTLVAFVDMGCPDCWAVLPFLGKIAAEHQNIRVVLKDKDASAETFLQERLGTGRVPTVLALNASGVLMDGAFVERPLEVHKAVAASPSRKDAIIAIGRFRNGGWNDLIEEDLLKVLYGTKTDVLPYLS